MVEDNGADVYLVKHALEQHGVEHRIVHSKDGDDALSQLRRFGSDLPRPDIILLDMNLPRRTGAEVLAVLRENGSCAGIPVVVMTSSDSPDDRRRAADFGVDVYFQKPSDLAAFVEIGGIIKTLVERGRRSATESA